MITSELVQAPGFFGRWRATDCESGRRCTQTITPPFPAGTTYHVSSEPTTAVAIGVSAKTVSGFTLAGGATVSCRVHLVV